MTERSGQPRRPRARALSVRSSVLLFAFAVLVGLSLAAAVSMLETQRPVAKHGGCAFPDGVSYCAMAAGDLGRHPYSYRPLVPLAARGTRAATDLSLIASFRVVAIAGLALTVGALAALGYVVSLRAGCSRRQAQAIAFAAPTLWFVTPFALRFALTAPVLTDELATGLSVAWLALLFAPWRRRWSWVLGPVAAVLATTAREAAFVTIAATCVAALALTVIERRHAYFNLAASALALVFDLTRPFMTSGFDASSAWATWLRRWINTPRAMLAALLMGVGFAVAALLPGVIRAVMKAVSQPRYVGVLLPAALAPILLSTFAGADVGRISSAATPVLSLILAFYLVLSARAAQVSLLAVAAGIFIAQWSLFEAIPRSEGGYRAYFYGVGEFGTATLAVLAAIAIAVMLLDLPSIRRPRPVAPEAPVG